MPTNDNGTTATTLLEAALAYARAGYHELPLNGKSPLESVGQPDVDGHIIERGAGGVKTATRVEGKLQRWWDAHPDANIGLATGLHLDAITGEPCPYPVYVLDVDVASGGVESLAELEAEHGPLSETVVQRTPSGGYHYFFRCSENIRNSASALAPGLDIRGTGGLVAVAPSRSPITGNRYQWVGDGLTTGHVADMDRWLLTLIKAQQRRNTVAPDATIPLGVQEASIMRIAGAMRRNGASRDEIRAAIEVTGKIRCMPPVADADLDRMADSASTYEPVSITATAAKTELGNAERLVHLHGERIMHNATDGRWYIWDGPRWQRDELGMIYQLAADVARRIELHAINMPNGTDASDDENRAYRAMEQWARKSQSERALAAMVKIAATMVAVTTADLDQHHHLLTVKNGTVDLRTGELLAHNPDHRITQLAPVIYDPAATLPEWDDFLAKLCTGQDGLQSFLQVATGYSATGETKEDKLFFAMGPTKTGKTTFIGAASGTLGDYAATANFASFLKKATNSSGASGDIARLAGKRFVPSIEVDEGRQLAEGLIKSMTGGDIQVARHLYKAEFEYRATHKLWLVANDAPMVSTEDDAIWERILRIPLVHQIPLKERDLGLKARLADPSYAGPAVLAWIVAGAVRWYAEGLQVPECITQATEDYKADQNPARAFLMDSVEFGKALQANTADVWSAYLSWCKTYRMKPLGKLTFQKHVVEAIGCDIKRASGGATRIYPGIALASSEMFGGDHD